jgi:hypothetical protein
VYIVLDNIVTYLATWVARSNVVVEALCHKPEGHCSPGAISIKLGTHIDICMCKNLMYVLYIYIYIYLSSKHQFPKGIWMIHVEEIKLLLLPGSRMVMTSRLATVVRRIHVSI